MPEPLALLHFVSINEARQILNCRGTSCVLKDKATFMVLFDTHVAKRIQYSPGTIILVFCTALINRNDFHWNNQCQKGRLGPKSMDPEQFRQAISKPSFRKLLRSTCHNEIVFHNSVPLSFMREIWTPDQKSKSILSNVQMGHNNIRMIQKSHYTKQKYICMPRLTKTQYCFNTTKIDLEDYRKLAQNCGIQKSFLDNIHSKHVIDSLILKTINRKCTE